MNIQKRSGLFVLCTIALVLVMNISIDGKDSQIPDHLKLLTSKENILGQIMVTGSNGKPDIVKYAFRSDMQVSKEPGNQVATAAVDAGVSDVHEDVNKRTKHSRTFTTDDPRIFITEIIPGAPQYYKDPKGKWWVADYATTTREAYALQTEETLIERIVGFFTGKKALATESTFYPDPDTETSSVDGMVRETTSASWATIIAAEGDLVNESGTGDAIVSIRSSSTSNEFDQLYRSIFLFDTSSIPNSDSVSAAVFSVAAHDFGGGFSTKFDDLSISPDFTVVSSNPTSTTSLIGSDFSTLGQVEFIDSRITYSSWPTTDGQYTNMTLNAAGRATISKTGVTKLGIRNGNYDLDATTPTWSSSASSSIGAKFAEASGTSTDPKLVVTHADPLDSSLNDNHVFFTSDATLNADRFIGQQELCTTGNRVDCEVLVPQNITVKGMSCFIEDGSSGDDVTFTLYDDGSATNIICSANGVQNCSIAGASVNIAADSLITVFADETFGAISGHGACTIRYINDV